MAISSIGNYKWSDYGQDINGLPELSESQAILDLASCKNSKKIMAECNSSTCAAVWASNNYSTVGTKTGDWCLPAAGVFASFAEQPTIISNEFKSAGGNVGINDSISSSSEADDKNKWYGRLYEGLSRGGKSHSSLIRPVIGFCKAGYEYDKSTDSCKSCDSSYKYTCTGSGYSGDSGTAYDCQ